MTPKQIKLARHALGLVCGIRTSCRNRFVAGPGNAHYQDWLDMVSAGYAVRRDGGRLSFGGDDLFHVTLSGAKKVVREDEVLSYGDFPGPLAS